MSRPLGRMRARMLGAVGLIALVCCAALFIPPAGEASFPGAYGKIAFASDRAAVGVAGTDPPAWTTARRDRVVVRDDGVMQLYALDGMLLYGRVEDLGPDGFQSVTTRPWMRVVNGRQLQVQGMPTGSGPVSIGRDATGRVVVVLGGYGSGGDVARWWLYDIARDAARRLRVPAEKDCVVDAVAVWRGRMAQAARCCRMAEAARCSRLQKWRVVVRDGAATTRVTKKNAGFGVSQLVLRNRSLAVIVSEGRFEQTLWRILDHGRRCPRVIGGTVDENGFWAGIGSGTLTWATAGYTFDFVTYDLFEVGDVDLSGRCQSAPRKRYMAPSLLPQTPIHGAYGSSGPAIDGRKLYYATDSAIHRLRLPARRRAATSREALTRRRSHSQLRSRPRSRVQYSACTTPNQDRHHRPARPTS